MDQERLIVVSGDSHATPPPEAWPHYVEAEYHDLLPGVYEDDERYIAFNSIIVNFTPEQLAVMDPEGRWASGGYTGAWDLDRRLAEMDRDGVAAELVFYGDPRHILPLLGMFREYPQDAIAAGSRAYHRWAADNFAPSLDRTLLVAEPTTAVSRDAMLAELQWVADHGFVGATLPNVYAQPLPPLYDEFWDPYWSVCADLGLTVVCHAGYGSQQLAFVQKVNALKAKMEEEGGTSLLEMIINNKDGFFAADLKPRRGMWHLMLGGVFDRHPDLHFMLAETRADWLPPTLRHLDDAFERSRRDVPAQRRPSEYWHTNCLTSLSFVHRAEVAMRHEIDIDTITFGRDFPHSEGTWPNTADWLSDAFAGVPDDELRLMLGENAVRVLGLDRDRLAAVAARIGPTIADVTGRTPQLDERLLADWDRRGGYLKPPEEVDHAAIDALLDGDLVALGARSV
jgi:predicted TIM-barrel fold metal-dependent hydrolase